LLRKVLNLIATSYMTSDEHASRKKELMAREKLMNAMKLLQFLGYLSMEKTRIAAYHKFGYK
jgi:hypothetical protein